MSRRWTFEDKGKSNQAERRAAAEVAKWDRICRVEGQKAAPRSRGSYTRGEGGDESPWGVSGGRRKGDCRDFDVSSWVDGGPVSWEGLSPEQGFEGMQEMGIW